MKRKPRYYIKLKSSSANNKRHRNSAFTMTVFIAMLLPTLPRAAEVWHVVVAEDPVKGSTVCLLQSAMQKVDDGQTKTPVRLVYNGQALYAVTKSLIDVTYPHVGLQVDDNAQFAIDHLHKNKVAVFVSHSNEIHQQFIDGRKATLALGFWPTWPKTETREMKFDLIGYTKAYRQFEKCLEKGGVGQL